MKITFRSMILALMLLMLAANISHADGATTGDTTVIPSAGFSGLYEPETVSMPDAFLGTDYELPVDLTNVKYLDKYGLSDEQLKMLSANGFVVKPAGWRQFHNIYEKLEYDELPVFATTDAVLHVYHLLFDKLLRELERDQLAAAIESFTTAMVDAAEAEYSKAVGTPMEDTAWRVLGYFAVAEQLIEETPPDAPDAVADVVAAELDQIDAHYGLQQSSLFYTGGPYWEDYSQYVPRGHYTRDDLLKRYFKTMMWYGRMNFSTSDEELTRAALLITHLMRNTDADGVPVMNLWSKVYDPTVFFVGKSDDLSIYDYEPLIKQIFGDAPNASDFADNAKLKSFIDAARMLPPPLINSMVVDLNEDKEEASRGFRLMGQRFVLDAYIFDELTEREVEDRMLPKALDVFAAMGHQTAYELLDGMGETQYLHYKTQLAKLKTIIDSFDTDMWTQNIYWDWLYTLQAVTSTKDDAYPAFMRGREWTLKDLHSALGSWTELKHDTILYAKQSMAECGDSEEPDKPVIRGYVEPNIAAYSRLLELTRMTQSGLTQLDILPWSMEYPLESLENKLGFLKDIATKELFGEEISAYDYDTLQYFGGWLSSMTLYSADVAGGGYPSYFEGDERAALVADVATDTGGAVLEEGVGRVFEIYVVTSDGVGGLQITKGAVFSYYEFPWPIGDRLTDEKWWNMLDKGTEPPQPSWTGEFISN